MGILLGYSNVGYRILTNNKITVARNVEFVEENVKCINLEEGESEYLSHSSLTLESSRSEESDLDNDLEDNVFESADENDELKNCIKKSEKENL